MVITACHLNIGSHLTSKQYKYLLNYTIEIGCQYITFNVPNAECDNCGFIAKLPFNKCPKRESEIISYFNIITGYLIKIKINATLDKNNKNKNIQHLRK